MFMLIWNYIQNVKWSSTLRCDRCPTTSWAQPTQAWSATPTSPSWWPSLASGMTTISHSRHSPLASVLSAMGWTVRTAVSKLSHASPSRLVSKLKHRDAVFNERFSAFNLFSLYHKQIPSGDPRLPSRPDSCIPSVRSAPACGTGFSAYNFGGEPNKREQINALTAFLDLSQVYGSEDKLALNLRDLSSDGGLMLVNSEFTDNGRELLPFQRVPSTMCATRKRVTNNTEAREVPCFVAG